jgi:ABC-type antimicrobial peptide transport system permease subunit
MVRTSGDPRTVIPELRGIMNHLDPTVPFRAPQTMEQVISDQLVLQRMESWLFGIFAGLAVLLAIVGLYGLISHEVEMRTHDIGIRMALGASRQSVLAMVLRRVAILLAIGIAGGLILTLAAQKLIASVVALHLAHQTGLLLMLIIGLAFTGLLAALLPARRAASIDPMQTLRAE